MPVNGLWSYVLKDRRLTLCDKVDLIQVARFYKEKFGQSGDRIQLLVDAHPFELSLLSRFYQGLTSAVELERCSLPYRSGADLAARDLLLAGGEYNLFFQYLVQFIKQLQSWDIDLVWFFDAAKFTSEKDYADRKERQSKRRMNVHRDVEQLLADASRLQSHASNRSESTASGDGPLASIAAMPTAKSRDSRDAQLADNSLAILSLLRYVVTDAIRETKCEFIQCPKGEVDKRIATEMRERGKKAVAVLTNNSDFAIFAGCRYIPLVMMKESRAKFQEKRHTDFLDLNDVLKLSAPELVPAPVRPAQWPVAFVSGQKLIDVYGFAKPQTLIELSILVGNNYTRPLLDPNSEFAKATKPQFAAATPAPTPGSDVRNGERSRDDWRSSDPLSQADTESGLSQLSQVNPVLLSQQSNASRLLADGRETPRSQTRGRAENPDSALLKKCAALLRQHRSVELVPLFQKELARKDELSEAVKKSRDYYSLVTKEDEDDNNNNGCSSNMRFVTQKVTKLDFPPEFIALCAGQYLQHNDPVLIPCCRSLLVTGSSIQSTPSRSTPIPASAGDLQSFSLPPKAKSGPVGNGNQSLALQAAPLNGSLLGARSSSSVGNCNPYMRYIGDVQNRSSTPTATCEPETATERDTTITSRSYQAPEVCASVPSVSSTSPSNALQASASVARQPHASAVLTAMLEHEPDWLLNDLEREQRAPAPAQPLSLQLPSAAIHPSMPPSLPIASSRSPSGSGSTTSNGAVLPARSARMKPLNEEQRAKLDMVLGSLSTTDAEPLTFVAELTSPPDESRGELGEQADDSRLLSEAHADARSEHSSEVTSTTSDMNPKPLCATCDTVLLPLRYYVYTLLRHDASNESAFEYSFNNYAGALITCPINLRVNEDASNLAEKLLTNCELPNLETRPFEERLDYFVHALASVEPLNRKPKNFLANFGPRALMSRSGQNVPQHQIRVGFVKHILRYFLLLNLPDGTRFVDGGTPFQQNNLCSLGLSAAEFEAVALAVLGAFNVHHCLLKQSLSAVLGASAVPKRDGGELQWLTLRLLAFQTRDSAPVSRRRIEAQGLIQAIYRHAAWLARLLALSEMPGAHELFSGALFSTLWYAATCTPPLEPEHPFAQLRNSLREQLFSQLRDICVDLEGFALR